MIKPIKALAAMVMAATAVTAISCGHGGRDTEDAPSVTEGIDSMIPMREITSGGKTYTIADIDDSSHVYMDSVDKSRCLIVISKEEYRLYVYEASVDGKDTLLAAHYPVCYAKYPEAKERSGDMRTPESSTENPFHIQQIQDASTWHHDFGDGRGSIPAYGAWFIRLETPGFSGVGIHGSTNNEASVPGRDSEGCIRLRDNDIIQLHDLYAAVGQPVIIKGMGQGKLPFEQRAQATAGDQYQKPHKGNKRATE